MAGVVQEDDPYAMNWLASPFIKHIFIHTTVTHFCRNGKVSKLRWVGGEIEIKMENNERGEKGRWEWKNIVRI